jgi:hypothetical protein
VGVGRTAISTTVIVAIGIWNGLLVAALVALIRWRNQVLTFITGSDHWNGNHRDSGGSNDDAWAAFLAAHPELHEPEVRAREPRER